MDPAYVALLILAVVYVPIWVWVWRRPEQAARWHLQKYGPCIMIKTRLGMKTMDRLAKHGRFWHAFGLCSKIVSAVLLVLIMYMLVVAVLAIPDQLSSGTSIGLQYVFAIPGFNPILPLTYGVVALVFAMVIHELGHGIQSRVNDIEVESSGLLYGVVPLGAFVEPNEEQVKAAPRKARIDMYAAGITMNTVAAVVSILIMIAALGCVSSDYSDDAGIYSMDANSPAYYAGLRSSDLIIGVEDADGGEYEELTTVLSGSTAYLDYQFDPTHRYYLTYVSEDGTHRTDEVQMGLYVRSVVSGSGADRAGLRPGVFVRSITVEGVEYMVGGPYDLTGVMQLTTAGQTVTLSVVDTGETEAYDVDVVLGSNGSIGYLGIGTTTGGMVFTTPQVLLDIASNPFYGADSAYGLVTSFFSYLSGPFDGMDPISSDVTWWYDAPGGTVFWMFVKLMYWIFWLDILLGMSNALPTYILDGGFIFAGGIEWLLEKFKVQDAERREKMADSVASSVSSVVLFLFVLAVIVMII